VTPSIATANDSLTRQGVTAGPVVAMLAVITLAIILAVLGVAYFMYLRDRR
jgi:heme/copper-type cytochrome/quinol oxidase subunit 4